MVKPPKINKEKAEELKAEIIKLCEKYGLHWKVGYEGTPGLEFIKLRLSIKVTDK